MLGSMLEKVARCRGVNVLAISRKGPNSFVAGEEAVAELLPRFDVSDRDVLVNCIGWIPQKSSGKLQEDEQMASALNIELVRQISEAQQRVGFQWLQIGTDCVFSGAEGGYTEASEKTATDLYSASKIAGEDFCENALTIRTSIVGPDSRSKAGLFAWFEGLPHGAQVDAYQNHLWNGVTTRVFASLCLGILNGGERFEGVQHFVPEGRLSKAEMLEIFATTIGRDDISLRLTDDLQNVDRTLATNNTDLNNRFWTLAGFSEAPAVDALLHQIAK